MFDAEYDISNLQPAHYNPRVISRESIEKLKSSIGELGLIKPIIVTRTGLIIAGHQRTTALKAIGVTHCPAVVLPPTNEADEVRFNQLHNGSDIEFADAEVQIEGLDGCSGFVTVPSIQITAGKTERFAARKAEILKLLIKYGEWGSCVATQSGKVLVSGLYASCVKQLGMKCLVYVLPDEKEDVVRTHFGQSYGEFSYAHLPKTTWGQTLAQKRRLRNDEVKGGKSRTYENIVIPLLSPGIRILDFGAGQMDYVRKLQNAGHDIRGVEFYYRSGSQINVSAVHRQIDALCADIRKNGLYDLVVCDSVLNSVDSVQAEEDVIRTLVALCKPATGKIVLSGRVRERADREANQRSSGGNYDVCRLYFMDENGLTAQYNAGVWLYQKFHTVDQVFDIADKYLAPPVRIVTNEGVAMQRGKVPSASGWGIAGHAPAEYDIEGHLPSVRREFNLPLPDGSCYGRSDDIESALRCAAKAVAPNR